MTKLNIVAGLLIISVGAIYATENHYRHEHYQSMLALCSLHTAGLHDWEVELERSLARKEHCATRAARDFEKRRLF